jgi:hypothetical protein
MNADDVIKKILDEVKHNFENKLHKRNTNYLNITKLKKYFDCDTIIYIINSVKEGILEYLKKSISRYYDLSLDETSLYIIPIPKQYDTSNRPTSDKKKQESNRKYREKNLEKLRENGREYYWNDQREKVRKYRKEYYAKNKKIESDRSKIWYQENKIELCKKTLNTIPKDTNEDNYKTLLQLYPFEKVESILKKILTNMRIGLHESVYQECYSAGLFAYINTMKYSSKKDYIKDEEHVLAYFKKLARIYIKAAWNLYKNNENIGKYNNLKTVNLDRIEEFGKTRASEYCLQTISDI